MGDCPETLSNTEFSSKNFVVVEIFDETGNTVRVANRVQQILTINCPYKLSVGDILRRKN